MEDVSAVKSHDRVALNCSSQTKIAHTIPEAVLTSGLSRSTIYIAIRSGALRARKCGARTLILDSDLRRFLRALPRFSKREPAA
jgi:Helix-turn-helix domain